MKEKIYGIIILLLVLGLYFLSCSDLKNNGPIIPIKIIDNYGVDIGIIKKELKKADELGFSFTIVKYELGNGINSIDSCIQLNSYKILTDSTYTDTITIVLVDTMGSNGELGFSTSSLDFDNVRIYPKYFRTIYISKDGLRQNTIPHEIGHVFGLKHTFDDGSEWGCTECMPQDYKYNYMSYNCFTDEWTPQQIIEAKEYHKKLKR